VRTTGSALQAIFFIIVSVFSFVYVPWTESQIKQSIKFVPPAPAEWMFLGLGLGPAINIALLAQLIWKTWVLGKCIRWWNSLEFGLMMMCLLSVLRKDYSGEYTILLIPCTVQPTQPWIEPGEKPLPCTAHAPER